LAKLVTSEGISDHSRNLNSNFGGRTKTHSVTSPVDRDIVDRCSIIGVPDDAFSRKPGQLSQLARQNNCQIYTIPQIQ
jgi:hypothetical protein